MNRKTSRNLKCWPLSFLATCSLVSGAANAATFDKVDLKAIQYGYLHESVIQDFAAVSSAAYNAECSEKVWQNPSHRNYPGPLTIDTPTKVEVYRCLESVSGDLTIDSPSSKGITLPWLRTVRGDIEMVGNNQMADARLPRLYQVDDRITVDAWTGAGTRWEANALTNHDGRFIVNSGTTTDLRGFNALEDIGTLQIDLRNVSYPRYQQSPNFEGLSGLLSVGKLDIDTAAEQASQEPDFLSNLSEVRGDALVRTKYALLGTDAIESVGDDLEIEISDNFGNPHADGLDSLIEVGRNFEWSGSAISNLDALANLEYVGGDLVLPLYVSSLQGLSGLMEVGGDFALEGSVNVSNLGALAALNRVDGRLSIENTPIESLAGLEGVQFLGGLTVSGNYSLANVSALGGATVAGNSTVVISNNSPLTHCQASSLMSAMNIPGSTTKTNTGNQSCYSFKKINYFRSF